MSQIRVYTNLSSTSTFLGERVSLRIEAMGEGDINLSALEITGGEVDILNKDISANTIIAEIAGFSLGEQLIGGELKYSLSGATHRIEIPEMSLIIEERYPGADQIGPPYSPVFNFNLLELLLIIIAALIIYRLLKRLIKKKKSEIKTSRITTSSPRERALNKIRELKEKNYIKDKKFKEHYDSISDILREYLEGVSGIKAMEATFSELSDRLESYYLHDQRERLISILSKCEVVKFSPDDYPASDANYIILAAERFINDDISSA